METEHIQTSRSTSWGRVPNPECPKTINIIESIIEEWKDKYRQPITVDHIFYDDVATVVFWTDGTKTVVKCAEGTKYDEYAAFCIALAKKIYGNNSTLKRAIKNHARYSKKRQIEKKFNDAKDNFEKIETENGIEEAVRKYVEHTHKNFADAFRINKEENKDA